KDGKFGKSDPSLISGDNPLGVDPEDPSGKDDLVTVNQLHIPVNRPVIVAVSSKDVIHSFNIPVLRVKQDTIPGQQIPIWFEATAPGHFELACAQLCGLGHYRMRADVLVDTPEDYGKWEAENAPPPQEAPAAAAPENQPAPRDARHDHGLPRRAAARGGRARQLRRATADRRARPGLPAAEHRLVLGVSARLHSHGIELLLPRRRGAVAVDKFSAPAPHQR